MLSDRQACPPASPDNATVLITACSGVFYDYYLDLLDSVQVLGLTPAFDVGVIDLGMNDGQRAELTARGVRIVEAYWPVEAPAGHDRIEYIAFAGKPFARDYFPGYQTYVWIDADMWVQTPQFWEELIAGATEKGLAVPVEHDENYAPMRPYWKLWMFRHYLVSFGLRQAFKLMRAPMLNNGIFAASADAPHWEAWQTCFREMVARGKRMIAIDQLALIAMLNQENRPYALLSANNNWVCSLAQPWWDSTRQLYVRPNEPQTVISLMHLTTPSRDREFELQTVDGKTVSRYLNRPNGRVIGQLLRQGPAQSGVSDGPEHDSVSPASRGG